MRADAAVLSAVWGTLRREGGGGLLRWWWGEVAGALPKGVRELLWAPRALALRRAAGGWRPAALAQLAVARDEAPAAPVGDPQSPALTKAALERAFADLPFGRGNVWLVLDRQELIIRRASLPLAAEEDLASALALDLDRLTPLPADRAYFGFRVVERAEERKALEVELMVVPRDVVAPWLAELKGAGLRVVGLGLAEELHAPSPVNLLSPADRDPYAIPAALVATRALAALAVVLAVAAAVAPVWYMREAAIALQPVLETAKTEAAVSDKLGREIDTLAGEHNFVVAKKHASPSLASLVEELSRELPDNTWVQQLEVKQAGKAREVQISGETGASSALIATLERPGVLQNATFKSPLTKGSTPNSERFLVAAELKPRALPEPMPEPGSGAPPAALPAGAAAAPATGGEAK